MACLHGTNLGMRGPMNKNVWGLIAVLILIMASCLSIPGDECKEVDYDEITSLKSSLCK